MFRRLLSFHPSKPTGQRAALFLILALVLSLSLSSQIGIVRAATLTVNSPNDTDDGACDIAPDCTLVEAINVANSSAGADIIEFDIGGGGAQTIALASALPDITDTLTIDGLSQPPGATCDAPLITLDGSAVTGNALNIFGAGAAGTIIRGLSISSFIGNGIDITGANGNSITCNVIGGGSGNSGEGISIASSNNTIGGTGAGNQISLNGANGVLVNSGSGNRISENSIFDNSLLGIELNPGANNDQAAPALTLAQSDGATGTTVTGTLTSTASTSFTIEFFQCDSTADEGQTLLGSIASLTTNGAGTTAINITLPTSLNIGDTVSATATSLTTNSTSAFSACETVIGMRVYQSNPPDGSTIPIGTSVGVPLSAIITVSNGGNETLDVTNYTIDNVADFTLMTTPPFSIPGSSPATTDIEVQCDATTTTGSPFTTILTVTHNAGADATYTIDCTVDPAPVPDYNSAPLPGGPITFGPVTVGTSNTANLIINNSGSGDLDVNTPVIAGVDAADFTILSGLPIDNLSGVGSVTVEIQCAPSSVGPRTADLTLTTNDPDAAEATVNYPLSCVGVAPVITMSPLTLPDTYEGDTTYAQTITGSGGTAPYTFARTGTLPTGMNFDGATGVLDGIPDPGTAGTYNFSIVATDANNFSSTPQAYSLVVHPPITVTPATLPDGDVAVPYTATIGATGGTGSYVSFVVTSGALHPDLALNVNTGAITGTPTTAGTFNFDVTVTDSLGAAGVQPYVLTINPGAPLYTSTPASGGTIAFGSTIVGTPLVNNTLSIDNTGTATLNVTGFTLGGLDPTVFTVTTAPFTLDPAPPAVPVSITCNPIAPGAFSATLDVAHNAAGSPATYTLTCDATAPGTPIYTSTPASGGTIAFGSTTVGTPLVNNTLSIDNTGTATLSVTAFTLGGLNPTVFTVTTAPFTLDPAPPAIPVSITCNPVAAGSFSATLDVTHNAAGSPATYTLTCDATTATGPVYSSVPAVGSPINMGSTPVGTPLTRANALRITNTGTANLTISGLLLSGGHLPDFLLNTSATPPIVVLPSASIDVSITCTPSVAGLRNTTLTVTHDAPGSPTTYTVNCTGTAPGTAIYDSTPLPGNPIIFGTVQVGTAISVNLTIFNRGTAVMEIQLPSGGFFSGTHGADFAITSTLPPFSVQAGGSHVVTIRCIPSSAGPRQANLNFRIIGDPARSSVAYPLQCTGSGTAVPTVTPIGFVPTVTPFIPTATAVLPATGTVEGVKGLALRTGPYLGATLIGKAIPGTPYPILAQSNDEGGGITWYLITVDTVTGWVSGLYLKVTGNLPVVPFQGSIFDQIDNAPDVGVTARAMSIIDIRRRPSGRAAILTQVPQDGIVRLLGRTRQNGGDFWVQINYNGVIGWIPAAPIDVHGSTGRVPIR